MGYLPLDFLKQVGALDIDFKDAINIFGSFLNIDLKDVSDTELVNAVLDPRFLDDEMEYVFGKRVDLLARLNNACKEHTKELSTLLGRELEGDNGIYVKGEWREALTVQSLLSTWQKFKQVYRFDKTLSTCLIESDDPKLSYSDLNTLPYRSFYLDFEDVELNSLKDVNGCFVDIRSPLADVMSISLIYVVAGSVYYSAFGCLIDKTDDKDKAVNVQSFGNYYDEEIDLITPLGSSDEAIHADNEIREQIKGKSIDHSQIVNFVYQCIKYLVSYKPDITESPITKKTYKKTKTIKNKFSEIHMEDVGYVWGAEFSRRMSAYEQRVSASVGTGKGSPKRPHSIRGHWHRHWVGPKDDQKMVVMWHEPTFTGGGTNNVEIHAVV